MKKSLGIIIILGILLVLVVAGLSYFEEAEAPRPFDPLNTTYTIDNDPLTLTNGLWEKENAPGSATKDVVRVFGEPVTGDLNGDGRIDAAIYLVENPGGTGTFYYAVVAINTPRGPVGTNAIFLGDRIAPQTIEIRNGQVIANYADRKPHEPFAVAPSIGVSKYLVLNGTTLEESSPSESAN